MRVYSEGPEDSPSRSLARYVARVAALYVPSHRIRLMARPDRFSSRQRSHVVQRSRLPGGRLSRSQRELREAAFGAGHRRRRRCRLPRAERARECRQPGRARAGAAGAGRDERARTGDDRTAALGLRRQPAVDSRRRAPRHIESTGATPGRTTGVTRAWSGTRLSSLCRASPSTITSSASPPSAPTVTKASSAPMWSDVQKRPDREAAAVEQRVRPRRESVRG